MNKYLIKVFLLVGVFVATVRPEADGQQVLPPDSLAIPPSLGKIEERYNAGSNRWIIQIQDVHAHLTAQENISAIVTHLNAVYGIRTIALEGAWSTTSLPKSWALPPSREKHMLARALLEEDYITGPVYSALFSPTPITLVGIEDKDLYEENRQTYVKHLKIREEVEGLVELYENDLEKEKEQTYNPDLLRLDRALQDFHKGKKPEAFFPLLMNWLAEHRVAMKDLDQLQLFRQIMAADSQIDKKQLQSEAERLYQDYRKEKLSFEELLRSGKIPPEKLEYYPETRKFLDLLKLQDRLSYRLFFQQIETATGRLKEKLIVSEEERRLDEKANRFEIAKKIILFQATPHDLKKFDNVRDLIHADMKTAGLEEALALGIDFYQTVKKRDQIFFDRLMNDKSLQGNVAVITGGFHTEGLSELLAKAGISFMVVTPDLANEAANEKLYFERLQEPLPASQTLSDLRNRPLTERFDEAFVRAEARIKQTRDIREGLEVVKTYQIGGAKSRAPQTAVVGELQDITEVPRDEALKAIQKAAIQIQKSTLPVYLFVRASALNKIFSESGEVARTLWRLVVSNKANKIVILYQSPGDIRDIEGIVNRNVTTSQQTDLDQVINHRRYKKARKEKLIAVIAADYLKKDYVILRESAVSLLVFRPLVERGWPFSYRDPKSISNLEDLLKEAIDRGLIQKAA